MMLKTSRDWIAKLAEQSTLIAGMRLDTTVKDKPLDVDAFRLANSDAHCDLIVRSIEGLAEIKSSSSNIASDLLRNLITRETYGSFAELAAYDWLTRCRIKFTCQVAMTPSDVLASNGSILDGMIEYNNSYFDVKAFGSNGRLVQRLKERLEEEISDKQVLIEESWDLSFEDLRSLIEDAPTIATDLRKSTCFRRDRILIRLEEKKPVTISSRGVEPYRLAKENALYPFKDAKQFARNSPFILMFVIHPWFNAFSIHNDFGSVDSIFTRSLARRAFMQFSGDLTPLNSVAKNVPLDLTLGDASRLLSAIFFVNVWPREADRANVGTLPSWLYINPRATNRLTYTDAALFRAQDILHTAIDHFIDDDY